MTCGIYRLSFTSGKFYIGRSTNINLRFQQHIKAMQNSTHHNYKVQEEFNKAGTPTLDILEVCDTESYCTREEYWISKSMSDPKILNLTGISSGFLPGERHAMSKYTNTQVYSVLKTFLENPTFTNFEISSITNVSNAMVGNILKGKNHTWLKQAYPEEYISLLGSVSSSRNSKIPLCKVIEVFKYILNSSTTSLKEVSDLFNISYETVRHISKGNSFLILKELFPEEHIKMLSLLGTRSTSKLKYNIFTKIKSPVGIVYDVTNRTDFANRFGLNNTALGNVLNGKSKHHKGWVAVK